MQEDYLPCVNNMELMQTNLKKHRIWVFHKSKVVIALK